MVAILLVVVVVLLAATIALAVNVVRYRTRRYQRGIFRPWPIRRIPIQEFDERFVPDAFGPTVQTEVSYIGVGTIGVAAGTSEFESWILAVMAKGATLMFEFGTCTGKTAYLWARNLPPDGRVVTLTLAPDQLATYQHQGGDGRRAAKIARRESRFTRFRYSGTDVEKKILQLFGDSKSFDETPYLDACDVVFVDGSHAYSYVISDSRKALRMVKPGGVVLWHDYGARRVVADVFRALNELARTLPLVHIAGTSLVAYRRPAGVAAAGEERSPSDAPALRRRVP